MPPSRGSRSGPPGWRAGRGRDLLKLRPDSLPSRPGPYRLQRFSMRPIRLTGGGTVPTPECEAGGGRVSRTAYATPAEGPVCGDVGPLCVLQWRDGLNVTRGPRADGEQRIRSAHRAIEIREKRRRAPRRFLLYATLQPPSSINDASAATNAFGSPRLRTSEEATRLSQATDVHPTHRGQLDRVRSPVQPVVVPWLHRRGWAARSDRLAP